MLLNIFDFIIIKKVFHLLSLILLRNDSMLYLSLPFHVGFSEIRAWLSGWSFLLNRESFFGCVLLGTAVVVALLALQDLPVAAQGIARLAGHAALPTGLDLAFARAAVAVLGVAVVADLADAGLHDAVAAPGPGLAGLPGIGAHPAGLEVAEVVAAVARLGVAVVAGLAGLDGSVTAHRNVRRGPRWSCRR